MPSIFSEKGLLKKNPLRGSSLANKFSDLAGKAGVADVYAQPTGLKDAASKVSAYTEEVGKGLPKQTEKLAGAEEKFHDYQKSLERVRENKGYAQKELDRVTQAMADPNFRGKYAAKPGQPERYQEYKEDLERQLQASKMKEQEVAAKKAEVDAERNRLLAKVKEKRAKQAEAATFRNYAQGYAHAIAGGMDRDQFLASAHGKFAPPPEVISEYGNAQSQLREYAGRVREARNKAEEHKRTYEQVYDNYRQSMLNRVGSAPVYAARERMSGELLGRKGKLQKKRRELGTMLGTGYATHRRARQLKHRMGMATAGVEYLI